MNHDSIYIYMFVEQSETCNPDLEALESPMFFLDDRIDRSKQTQIPWRGPFSTGSVDLEVLFVVVRWAFNSRGPHIADSHTKLVLTSSVMERS